MFVSIKSNFVQYFQAVNYASYNLRNVFVYQLIIDRLSIDFNKFTLLLFLSIY